MRIINRCNAPLDRRWIKATNRATGNRIAELIIRRPNPKRYPDDANLHASIEIIPNTGKSKVVIRAPLGISKQTVEEWWSHELAEMLLAYGEKEIVCDGFAENLRTGR